MSIVPHGAGALGYTLQRPSEDRHLLQHGELQDKLAVLLGGRSAEILVFGESSTGAADDLVKATNLARDMVLRFGMDRVIGPVVYDERPASVFGVPHEMSPAPLAASEQTARRIDEAVHDLLENAARRATHLLSERREVLDRCTRELITRETLEEAELAELVAKSPPHEVGPVTRHEAPAAVAP